MERKKLASTFNFHAAKFLAITTALPFEETADQFWELLTEFYLSSFPSPFSLSKRVSGLMNEALENGQTESCQAVKMLLPQIQILLEIACPTKIVPLLDKIIQCCDAFVEKQRIHGACLSFLLNAFESISQRHLSRSGIQY